ncbi:MAG: type I secretion system permease/ATPase [Pseudomonadota bacterium]
MKQPNTKPSELRSALAQHKRIFVVVGLFSAFINLLYLSPSLYMLQVYDRVISSNNLLTLAMLSILLFGIYIIMAILEWARTRTVTRLGNQLDQKLAYRIFEAAFQRNLKGKNHAAGMAMSDLSQVRQFITGPGLNAIFDAPWIPIYIAVIWLFHPLLGTVALVGVLLLVLMALLTELTTKSPLRDANKAAQRGNQFATSTLRNAEVIQAMGMLDTLGARWRNIQQEFLTSQSKASDNAGNITASTKLLRLTLQSAGLGVGAYLVIQAQITPGMMIAGSILMGRSLSPAEALIGAWKQFVSARDAQERLNEMLAENPMTEPRLSLPSAKGLLQLEQVLAGPPGAQTPTLKGITLSARPGEILVIIGPSASGKSTLARVMVGVWPVRNGAVRIDGAEMSQWNRSEIGPSIGYLPQDVELFEGTVAENIARFTQADSNDIIAAARKAGLHEAILKLPQGYDSPIGEAGSSLSGGQKQRIALARALFGNPALLVLDEPNANLDETGEQALQQALVQARQAGKTIVVITHRSHMLAVADTIAVLKDGTVMLHGPRDQVLETLKNNRAGALKNNASAKTPPLQNVAT